MKFMCPKCNYMEFFSIYGLSAHVNKEHPEMKHLNN